MKYILIAVILIPFLSFCAVTVNNFIVDRKNGAKASPKSVYTLLALISVILSAAAYISNLGYIRVVLFIPMYLHTILFFFITYGASGYAKASGIMNIVIRISLIAFLLANILLPDNAMYGYDYAFFSLIKNRTATKVCSIASGIAYFASITALVTQVILWLVSKKRRK